MKLLTLGSSSRGNSYILIGESETLIIEAGVPLSLVKKALDFDLSSVVAVCVSHSHGDHFGYIRQYLQAGIPVLTGSETFKAKDLEEYRYLFREAHAGKGYKIGEFRILAFDLAHDMSCLGYHINHPESGNILFLTDTFYCPYTFESLNHIMIEANYADDILDRNIDAGRIHPAFKPRLMYTHMELETVKGVLQSNDLSQVSNIILLHLSDGNSDQDRFVKEIREVTGKQVYVAEKGFEISLNKTPF